MFQIYKKIISNGKEKMRLKQYILENKKLDIDYKIYKEALDNLSKQYKVDKKYLKYIGYSDVKWKSPEAKLIQFNIVKKDHKNYKSTVGYKYKYTTGEK